MVVQILIITITTFATITITTVTMRINLAGEVVQLLLLLPQPVLQVLLLLLQARHLITMIIIPGLIFWILDSLSGGTSNLLLVSSPGLEVGHLPPQAGDLVLLVLHVQLHCLDIRVIARLQNQFFLLRASLISI